MVLMAMSMLLFLPGIYVFNGLANIFFYLCARISIHSEALQLLLVKVKPFSNFSKFTSY